LQWILFVQLVYANEKHNVLLYFHSFLLANNIPMHRHITFCLSIYRLAVTWINSALLWTSTPRLWCGHVFYLFYIYTWLAVEFLSCKVILCFVFWETATLFSKESTHFTFLPGMNWIPHCPNPCYVCYCLTFNYSHSTVTEMIFHCCSNLLFPKD
jgi:hypothetical protein